jgi:hypothetical protein
MNCNHTIRVIDAGPFADCSPATLEAARVHARSCEACGAALEAMTELTSGLPTLRAQMAAPDVTSTVMARIAEFERANPGRVAHEEPDPRRARRENVAVLAPALGALVAACIVMATTKSLDVTQVNVLTRHAPVAANLSAGSLAALASFLLYIVSLSVPLGGRAMRRQRHEPPVD